MSELFRKIVLVFTAFILIAATGGYSVYQHICKCEGAVITSVFLELDCEHDQDVEASSCCSTVPAEKSCCAEKQEKACDDKHHSGDCCHTNSLFLKINDSFNTSQEKSISNIVLAPFSLFENDFYEVEAQTQPEKQYISCKSPPIPGRQILLRIHQLKLSPELV